MRRSSIGKFLVLFVSLIFVIVLVGCTAKPTESAVDTTKPAGTTAAATTKSITTAAATTTGTAAETTAKSDPQLLGKWVEEDIKEIFGLPYKSIEFFEDGTSAIGEDKGTYKIVDGQLQCTFDGIVYTGDYEISGTKLTIYKPDGQYKVYIKEGTEAGNDPELIGKWVEESNTIIFGLPYKGIEFFEDGTSAIGEDQGTYQIVNGQLQCTFEGVVYTGDYEINGTKLTIYRADGQYKVYIKEGTATESDPELIGKWVEENNKEIFGLPYKNIEFFEDGTSIIEGEHGTYAIVDGKLECTFDGIVYTGKYEISGTKLTIYKADGQFKVYIKEG